MTLNAAIKALEEARDKFGGASGFIHLFVNTGEQIKWDEQMVVKIEAVKDGESNYVKLTTQGRG